MEDLSSRKTQPSRKYTHFVEFEVKIGTKDKLLKVGGTHSSARTSYPELPEHRPGSGLVEIKFESDETLSLGLGVSEDGLRIFNENLIRWKQL